MPVHGIDNGNNKHEVYTTEELLAILQQAIDSGSLQGIDPSKAPIVAAVRESHNNSNVTFWSGTEAEFNALVGVTSELVGARIGNDGKLYLLTGDTTLSDTVQACYDAALEATAGMKREVISVTLRADKWSNTLPYTQTVAVPGMRADKDFLAPYVEPTGNENDDIAAQVALSCISGGETGRDQVTFYCYDEKPTTTITVFMVDKGTKIEPGDYPVASADKLGVIRVGDNLSIDPETGILSATGGGGGSITVDSALSTTSTNPVQNKVITNALNAKAASSDVAETYATKTELSGEVDSLESQIGALASGAPLVADDISGMTDTDRVYVLTTDGHWYYYNGSEWTDGGIYQATGLPDNSVTTSKIAGHELPFAEANLINYRELIDGYITNSGEFRPGQISGTGLNKCTDFIPVDASTQYRSGGCDVAIQCFDSSKTHIGRATQKSSTWDTWTLKEGTAYIRINVGRVKSSEEYDYSLAVVSTVAKSVPFSFGIDQLYEKSNCYLFFAADIGGGLSIDWTNNQVIIRKCIFCTIENNKEHYILKEAGTNSDYVLCNLSSGANVLYWNRKTKQVETTNWGTDQKAFDNDCIPFGVVHTNRKDAWINGYGSYSENAKPYQVYYRPDKTGEYVSWVRNGGSVTVNFPAGSFYIFDAHGRLIRSYASGYPTHEAASYTLDNQKLMMNLTTFELYVEGLASGTIDDGSAVTLLVSVQGKLHAGALLPDVLYQNVEYRVSKIDVPDTTIIKGNSFFDFEFSQNEGINGISDMTFVGDELWMFAGSNDAHTNYSNCYRYSVDFENKSVTLLGSFKHNFGHCNTVDYCAGNDTLILGNGGQSSNTEPDQIYIIQNASSLKNNAQNSLADVAVVIDLDAAGLDWGKQVNVCWAEANNGAYDMAYVISNMADGGTKYVHKIQLGKASNNLGKGTLIEVESNEFNGTFKIIKEYTGTYYQTTCNQGSQFYKGYLYEAIGHNGAWIFKNTLTQDGDIYRREFREQYYNDSGVLNSEYQEGCCIKDDKLFLTLSNPLRLAVYKI